MDWIAASLVAAAFLGLYELATKHGVQGNAVVPVVFFGTLTAAGIWAGLLACGALLPAALPEGLRVDPLSWREHGLILLKSVIVAVSWLFTFVAVKHLPVSLAGPVRATGPFWTFLGALAVFGERPHPWQAVGVLVTLGSFWLLSWAGRSEGVRFAGNRWVAYLLVGTLLGSVSGLYDKYLFGTLLLRAPTVQAWFHFYLAVLFLPLYLGWRNAWWPPAEAKFHWRWSIPGIGAALLVADYLYFWALRDADALVSVVTAIRRTSVLVSFAGGLLWFGERYGWRKALAVAGILLGLSLIILG